MNALEGLGYIGAGISGGPQAVMDLRTGQSNLDTAEMERWLKIVTDPKFSPDLRRDAAKGLVQNKSFKQLANWAGRPDLLDPHYMLDIMGQVRAEFDETVRQEETLKGKRLGPYYESPSQQFYNMGRGLSYQKRFGGESMTFDEEQDAWDQYQKLQEEYTLLDPNSDQAMRLMERMRRIQNYLQGGIYTPPGKKPTLPEKARPGALGALGDTTSERTGLNRQELIDALKKVP